MNSDTLSRKNYNYFEQYNERYDKGAFSGSEACAYDLAAIKKWISIRDNYTYTDNCEGTNWKYIRIVRRGTETKYGTKYIFIDPDRKLWRIKTTGQEFYHGPECEEFTD